MRWTKILEELEEAKRLPDNHPMAELRQCECGQDAVLRQVKNGKPENIGRHFWSCSKPKDQGCGYFKWAKFAEEPDEQMPPNGHRSPPVQLPPKNQMNKKQNIGQKRKQPEPSTDSNEKGVALTLLAEKIMKLEQDVKADSDHHEQWMSRVNQHLEFIIARIDNVTNMDDPIQSFFHNKKQAPPKRPPNHPNSRIPQPATPPRPDREATPEVEMEDGEIRENSPN